jgi:Rieske Fe-S protein
VKLDESMIDRRQFLDGLIAASLAGLGATGTYTALGYLTGQEEKEPEKGIDVSGKALETLTAQKFVLVKYGPHPVIVFTLPDGQLRALSAVCTHGQCNVRYRPEENDLYCGCHYGRYTADGVNVPGTPPPRPLRQFDVQRQNDGTLHVAAIKSDAAGQEGQTPAKAGAKNAV